MNNSTGSMPQVKSPTLVQIDYTNHRGERSVRTVRPARLYFGATAYHKESQWLLEAQDMEKNQPRTFAMANVHAWYAIPAVLEPESEAGLTP